MFDEVSIPRLVIAGARSGVGKTTVALGLTAALRRRGRIVQTFKIGADFVDCAYLSHTSGRPCRNIDTWLLGELGLRRALVAGTRTADCAVIEGVMGIFDGHGSRSETSRGAGFTGSTAEVARFARAPLVLVLDIGDMGETAAAIALGVKHLDPSLRLAGVILNNVPSHVRRRTVEDAVWQGAKLPVLGALPHTDAAHVPEMRDGLLPITQNPRIDTAIDLLAAAVERHCDLDLIERIMSGASPLPAPQRVPRATRTGIRVGVAFDEAFSLYYAENLELLEHAGAKIVPFSPLDDRGVPEHVDALYLGPGFPEAFAARLASNRAMLESLHRAYQRGVLVYAECGGLQLLARTLRAHDGAVHTMAGVLPVDLEIEQGHCQTGYRELRLATTCALGPRGTRLRGHEFHYSRLREGTDRLQPLYTMHDSEGEPFGFEGWVGPNLMASFVHLHFAQDPALVERLVGAIATSRAQRREPTYG